MSTRLAVTLLVAALAAACSLDSEASSGEADEQGPRATATSTSTSTTAVTLPATGVSPGTCALIEYTPPLGSEPHEGELCVPAGRHRDVGIVLVHGGGGKFGDHTGVQGWVEGYGAEGYVTLAIDYHLFDTGDDDDSPVFPHPEQDVKAAVQYLRGHAGDVGIDPERIVVQGLSAGARLGAVAHTSGNDPYFHGADTWPAIPDHVNVFIGLYSTYDATLEDDGFYYGGDRDDEDPEVRRRWVEADALVNAGQATAPALFFTGEDDWEALVTQMESYVDSLREAGVEAHATVVPDGDHGFDQAGGELTSSGEEVLGAILLWLDAHFP